MISYIWLCPTRARFEFYFIASIIFSTITEKPISIKYILFFKSSSLSSKFTSSKAFFNSSTYLFVSLIQVSYWPPITWKRIRSWSKLQEAWLPVFKTTRYPSYKFNSFATFDATNKRWPVKVLPSSKFYWRLFKSV